MDFWPSSKEVEKLPAVGAPTCVEECEAKCATHTTDAPTSGGRRKKSLKKGGRKSRTSRSYRSTSRGCKSRGSKSRRSKSRA